MSFMAQSKTGSVLFKIKTSSCREIFDYSYRPHERELLLPPMSRFVVKGVFEASAYNLGFGDQVPLFLALIFQKP